jgi:hypothetical protein
LPTPRVDRYRGRSPVRIRPSGFESPGPRWPYAGSGWTGRVEPVLLAGSAWAAGPGPVILPARPLERRALPAALVPFRRRLSHAACALAPTYPEPTYPEGISDCFKLRACATIQLATKSGRVEQTPGCPGPIPANQPFCVPMWPGCRRPTASPSQPSRTCPGPSRAFRSSVARQYPLCAVSTPTSAASTPNAPTISMSFVPLCQFPVAHRQSVPCWLAGGSRAVSTPGLCLCGWALPVHSSAFAHLTSRASATSVQRACLDPWTAVRVPAYPGPVARLPRVTGLQPLSPPAGPAPRTSVRHRATGSARGLARPRPAPPLQGASSIGPQIFNLTHKYCNLPPAIFQSSTCENAW